MKTKTIESVVISNDALDAEGAELPGWVLVERDAEDPDGTCVLAVALYRRDLESPPAPKGPEPADVNKLDLNKLSNDELLELLCRVNVEWTGRSDSSFVDQLKEVLAGHSEVRAYVKMHGPVVRAKFTTTDYDNGWFFDEDSPTLTFRDGTVYETNIGSFENRHLGRAMATVSEAYQPLGSGATYTVDLVTGDTDQEDYDEFDGLPGTKVTETTVVRIGNTPGEQYGWKCADCDVVSGLQWGTEAAAQEALGTHLRADREGYGDDDTDEETG